jgi:hypothetical protein
MDEVFRVYLASGILQVEKGKIFYGQFIKTISSGFHLSHLGPEIQHPGEIMGPEF